MDNTIRALVWDFGGVLLRTEDQQPRRMWERKLDLTPGQLHDLVFLGAASRQATIGQASTDEIWQSLADELGLDPETLSELRSDFWAGDVLDHGLIQTTRELKKQLKTALLSNAWPDLRRYLEDGLQIDDAFDVLIISAEEGTAKPGEDIYRILTDRLEVNPQECVFIDDSHENVLAAGELGIHTILFRDREQALAELRSILPAKYLPLLQNTNQS